ncbi:MAG: hypothetical protein WC471_02695 [Candidatus Woesearchaeota archaeon]
MVSEQISKQIINFVKAEPKSIQEISKFIKKSWVTTDSYASQIKENTGLIGIKMFRGGTQGALKLVYFNNSNSIVSDDIKEGLFNQIKTGRRKTDFDFMEIYQFIPSEDKRSFIEEYDKEHVSKIQEIVPLLRRAKRQIYCFSGNLSLLNLVEKNIKVIDVLEQLLGQGVKLKVLMRVNIASIGNLNKIAPLIQRYPDQIEIHHAYQPLRGYIIDEEVARFINEENIALYRNDELKKNTRIFYEINNYEWINWLQKIFWNIFKSSIDHRERLKEIKKIF